MIFADHYYRWLKRAIDEATSGNPFYLPRRVGYAAKKKLVDWRFSSAHIPQGNRYFSPSIPEDAAELMEYFRRRRNPVFHFQSEDIEEIVARIPSTLQAKTIEAAEEIARHRFTFRGFSPITLHPVDWQYAPNNHPGWGRDLNRQFYFMQLGFAYRYTKDVHFARTFLELSSSWIEQNANRLGKLRRDDPFEVAARVNAWVWAYFLFLDCPQWDAKQHEHFLKTLVTLSEYLYQTIEYHRPGNHILLEAKALALCAGLFPEFERSRRWAAKGWSILRREIRSQICLDGVHAERSTMYHRIIAGELAELLHLCHRNNIPHVDDLAVAVRKMADFENWITAENGLMPLLGDAYSTDTYDRFSAPVIIAALSNGDEISRPVAPPTDHNYWVLSTHPQRCQSTSAFYSSPTEVSKNFPDGGYFVSRSNTPGKTSVLVWDCGSVGYKTNLYHSHLDTLSFFLAIEGTPIFVDPGTDEIDVNKRRYLRGTGAHNTVRVDGHDQSAWTGDNRISRPARATFIWRATSPEYDVMIGSHDGYETLPNPVVHTRTLISMRDQYWVISDRLDGRGYHRGEQKLHLAPGATVKWERDHKQLSIEKSGISLIVAPISLTKAGEGRPTAWTQIENGFAELDCGHCDPIKVINTIGTGPVPFSIAAVLWHRGAIDGITCAEVLDTLTSNSVQGIEIEGPAFRDKIFFSLEGKKKQRLLDCWETDASIVILRHAPDGAVTSALVVDASTFVHDSREYIDANNADRFQRIRFQGRGPMP